MNWYLKQTKRWNRLTEMGCTYTDEGTDKFVGLGLSIGNHGLVVMVPKTMMFKEIHTTILETCENFYLFPSWLDSIF